MNIKNVDGTTPVQAAAPAYPIFRPIPGITTASNAPVVRDSFGRIVQEKEITSVEFKPLDEARSDFKSALRELKAQNEDDRAAVLSMVDMVNQRDDLSSRQKEYLLCHEVMAYGAENVMKMTGWDKKDQPWTPVQQQRFDAIGKTFFAAKELSASLTPKLEKADPPEAPAPAPAANNAAPPQPPAQEPAPTPPAEPAPHPDPLVRMAQKRRKRAEEIFTQFKDYMSQVAAWRKEIWQMRQDSALKILGLYSGYLGQGWRRR